MDNREFSIVDDENFGEWLKCAFGTDRAVGWSEGTTKHGTPRLILYWSRPDDDEKGFHRFPVRLSAEDVEPILSAWLIGAKYGEPPDHDGDNKKGFHIFNYEHDEKYDTQVHAGGTHGSILGLQPAWACYGK